MTQRIIIDTDPGVDDSMAILLALASPEVQVEALTIVFGNTEDVEMLGRNGLAVLELAGRGDIPVAFGARGPLARPYTGRGHLVHGRNGLGEVEVPPPAGRPIGAPAAAYLVERIMAEPGEFTLVALGPLTNLALAYRMEPRIVENVQGLAIMGGATLVKGNASPVGEANIRNDPEAAKIVFNAGWKRFIMAGLEATQQVSMDRAYLQELKAVGNRAGGFIHDIAQFYLASYTRRLGIEYFFVHDSSALMNLIRPELFERRAVTVDVETAGELTAGQTVADWNNQWGRQPNVEVCVKVDAPAFLELYKERVASLP